jgi:hypothetical protein
MYRKLIPSAAITASILAIPATAMATTRPPEEPGLCAPFFGISEQFDSDAPDPATVTELLGDLEAAIPAELADPGAVLVESVTAGLGGDMAVFESDEFLEALSATEAWIFEHCAFDTRIDVTAVDWAFGGIPLEVPAGHVAFRVTNAGGEMHEMGILRRIDGATQNWDEIAQIATDGDESALEGIAEWVAHAWIPDSDTSAIAYADLTPGEYAAICAMPVGTNHEMSDEDWEALAVPGYEAHWMHGMLQPFTVVEAG